MAFLKLGVCALTLSAKEKKGLKLYDKLFAFCDKHLPRCGCDVVLLPEYTQLDLAEGKEGPLFRRFATLARDCGLCLIAPVPERAGRKMYNRQLVISPAGKVVYAYRKVHLAPKEYHTLPGGSFGTFELPWGRAGLMICFDNQLPESSRILAVQGARIIFWPSFGDLAKPHRNAARCLDNHIYLAGSSVIDLACGYPANAFETGMVMDPSGKVLADTGARQGFAVARIPLAKEKIPAPEVSPNYLARRRRMAYRALI